MTHIAVMLVLTELLVRVRNEHTADLIDKTSPQRIWTVVHERSCYSINLTLPRRTRFLVLHSFTKYRWNMKQAKALATFQTPPVVDSTLEMES